MSLFWWKAVDADGRTCSGRSQARDDGLLEQLLQRQGLSLIRAVDVSRLPLLHGGLGLKRRQQHLLCIELQQQLQAGIPVQEALASLAEDGGAKAQQRLLRLVLDEVRTGTPLSLALQQHVWPDQPIALALLHAGETSGQLPDMLAQLARLLAWQEDFLTHTRGILAYPLFALSMILLAGGFLFIYLLPPLGQFLAGLGTVLPWHTRWLLQGAALLRDGGWLWLLPASLLPVALMARLPLLHACHRFGLRLALVGPLLRCRRLALLARVMALLYGAGLSLVEVLRLCAPLGGAAFRAALELALLSVQQGASLSDSLRLTDTFPAMLLRLVRSGEQSGQLEQALQEAAGFYEREAGQRLHLLQTLLEPVLTLLAGSVLAFLIVSVLGPVYQVVAGVRP